MSAPGTIRALIVDDEAPARALVREYLAAHPDIAIVAECANGFEAVKAAAAGKPDLVFLDIQMPKLDGFEVLELLDAPVETIFITAFDEHALRAFSVHAVDYLLKPVEPTRFAEALDRARRRIAAARVAAGEVSVQDARRSQESRADAGKGRGASRAASRDADPTHTASNPMASPASLGSALGAAARGPGRHAERIVIRDGAKVQVIPIDAVDCIQAQDDYVNVRAHGKNHLKLQTLDEIATTLDPARFVRIHRSFILNIERLAKIELYAKDSREAILTDGTRIPVSRAGYQRLRELL